MVASLSHEKCRCCPIPKQKPVKEINKHSRPLPLTSIVSKVAENFIVESFINSTVLRKVDRNQFEVIPNSSTHALVSMIHNWNKLTDGNGQPYGLFFFDFKKAFDFIDQRILIQKLCSYNNHIKSLAGLLVSYRTVNNLQN